MVILKGNFFKGGHTTPRWSTYLNACLNLTKNKQAEIINENSKNLNCEIDFLGTR